MGRRNIIDLKFFMDRSVDSTVNFYDGTPCREWNRAKNTSGYGFYSDNYKNKLSHRGIYELIYGPIKNGMCVCHGCDNILCLNIKHLFLGTHADNMADRNNKNRQFKGYASSKLQRSHPKKMGTTSKFKGVSFHKRDNVWMAYISINYKLKHLGYFTSEVQAAQAHDDALRKYYPDEIHCFNITAYSY